MMVMVRVRMTPMIMPKNTANVSALVILAPRNILFATIQALVDPVIQVNH